MADGTTLGRASCTIGATPYRVDIASGGHRLVADEPPAIGGGGQGPAPFDLLMAALGACSCATLKMYAERKQWPLDEVLVALRFVRSEAGDQIARTVTLLGDLDDSQRQRFAEIIERTPVTLVIKSGTAINTRFSPPADPESA